MSAERRRADHVRFPVQIPVVLESKGPPAELPISGQTENLSRGGARIQAGRAAQPGSALRVTFLLRRPVSLTLTGTVVWIQRQALPPAVKLGLQFGEELSEYLVTQIAESRPVPREV